MLQSLARKFALYSAFAFGISCFGQTIQPSLIVPQDRITSAIVPSVRTVIPNLVYPAIASAKSSQEVESGFELQHMILTLQPSATQQSALTSLLTQQLNPNSPNFHKFLTPAQFAASFGVSKNDLAKIETWLTGNGFHIDEMVPNNLAIVFSGTASQVEATFNTQIRQYVVNGETHYANATAPEIPTALASVVQGLVKLNDFHSKSPSVNPKALPLYNAASGAHYLVPADYAVIYDLNALYQSGFSGAAQTIAIVGRSDVNSSDIASFRADYGLPGNAITPVYATGTDPGITGNADTIEGTLDVEWAGAVAPKANIDYVIAASTAVSDGVDLAAQYAVAHNVAPILSVSYGACEASANNAFYNNLWQQAAAQGISVIVAAGDSGAAGCDSSTATIGTVQSVNAICSTPYDTCVGGTMFNDTVNPGQYWYPGNNAVMGSAVSYIPEVAWNESALNGGSGLIASGGGESGVYLKPYWQTGTGVPADGHRDVPDVALTAAQHDGYIIYYDGAPMSVAGTSAATPSFAAIVALVNQKVGSSQGNINQVLYPLATHGSQTGTAIFHDVTTGNNSVPGVSGYGATPGYDLVTGLGSVDATLLANNWTSVTGGFTLTASANSVNVAPGINGSLTLSVADLGTFNSAVTLILTSTLPAGVVGNFAPGTITGNGSSLLTFAASGSAISGTYPVTVTANGANFTRTVSFNLVVIVSTNCVLSASPTLLTVVQGQATSAKLVCGSAQGIFSSPLSLSITGTPTGATSSFSPAATLVPSTGVSNLIINATTAATPGTYNVVVKATLPNSTFSTSISIPITINAPATFKVTPSATSLSIAQGTGATLTLSSLHSGSFNNPITFQTSGLPSSVSATLSASTIAAPGDGTLTITLQATSIATPTTYTMTVLAQGGGLSLKIPIAVQVTAAPSFTLTSSSAVMTLRQTYVPTIGTPTPGTASLVFTTGTLTNNFNAPIILSISTLPTGVTAAFSPSTISAPGGGASTLTLTASATATTGISTFTVTAVGGTITRTVTIKLTLTPPPNFSLSVQYPTYTLMAGSSISQTVTSTPLNGYNSNIQLTATAAAGINVLFSPTTISGAYGTSKITIQPAITLAAGTYPITVTATDPLTGNVQTATINFVVASVATTISSTSISMTPGSVTTATVTTAAASYTGNVVLSITGLPAGMSYSFNPSSIAGGTGSSTLTILAGSSTATGSYLVTVKSTAGGVTFTMVFALTIT